MASGRDRAEPPERLKCHSLRPHPSYLPSVEITDNDIDQAISIDIDELDLSIVYDAQVFRQRVRTAERALFQPSQPLEQRGRADRKKDDIGMSFPIQVNHPDVASCDVISPSSTENVFCV